MTISIKSPTSTTGSIQKNGSDVLTIDSSDNVTVVNNLSVSGTVSSTGAITFDGGVSGNVNFDSGTLYVDATNNRVGIGTSSPAHALQVNKASGNTYIKVERANQTTGQVGLQIGGGTSSTDWLTYMPTSSNDLAFFGNSAERMRIDSSGDVLVGTTSKSNIAGVPPNHMFVRSAADAQWTLSLQNTAASGGARGLCINYSGQSPNNTNMEPMFFSDSVNYRFALRSNGGIANYSANNVNISDRREKTNFAPAKSYLQTICSIPVQTFNYIDQNLREDDGLTLGVVAQDVQAVAPELVTESDWGSDGNPKMRLSVYQTDLTYALMKCIQEQQEIITALEARVEALENPS